MDLEPDPKSPISRAELLKRGAVAGGALVAGGYLLSGELARAATRVSSAVEAAALSPATVTFGNFPVFDLGPWYAAEKWGYFDDVDITLKTRIFPDETKGLQAIGGKSVQTQLVSELTLAGVAPTFKNIRTVMLPNIFLGFAPIIRPDSGMKTYAEIRKSVNNPQQALQQTCAQVKGKTWLVLLGASFDTTLDRVLQLGGLTRDDVKITNIGPIEGATAFQRGEGDIYLGDVPRRLRLQEQGNLPLVTARELGPLAWVYPIIVADKGYIAKNEDTLLRLISVWYRALDTLAKGGARRTQGLQAMADFVNEASGTSFTVKDADTVERQIYLQPDFEGAKRAWFTPGVSTNWNTRLRFAVTTRVQQGQIQPGEVKPANLTVAEPFYDKLVRYRRQALQGIREGGPNARRARVLVAQRNYLDAARLFQ